jgi:transposase
MQATTIGIDLAKTVFQIHGVDATGKIVITRQLRRSQLIAFFHKLSPCLVGIEACATAHHWARELMKLGRTVRLMPASYVKAYVKRCRRDLRSGDASKHAAYQRLASALGRDWSRRAARRRWIEITAHHRA